MATYTPNIDLKKPAQSDKIRIADLNGNADNIDAALGADFGVSNKPSVDDAVNSLGAGLAIISNGDIHAAITAGQYVYVRGHGTLTEGLYVATANVSQNGALTGNNVDAVSGGGLNALNSKTTITTTKLWADDISLLAEKNNRITCCSGWIKLNASSYTDQMPLFRLNETLTNFVYFFDDKGDVYRVQSNGEVIFHNPTTIPTDQYRFVLFAFCN